MIFSKYGKPVLKSFFVAIEMFNATKASLTSFRKWLYE